jgi:general secretion pathway protein D
MKRTLILLFAMTLGIQAIPALAESAEHAYKAGDSAEKKNDYDAAFEAYKEAHELKPNDPKYEAAYLRLRFYAGSEHIRAGQRLRDAGKLQEAMAEFHHAADMDATNFGALQEIRRTADLIQKQVTEKENAAKAKTPPSTLEKEAESAAGPVSLDLKSDMPVTLHLTTTTDVVYKTLAKLGGINVLIDPDYKPQKINFELNDVSLREALDMFAMQSKTFWRPLSPNTIMVTSDTGSKRKEYEQNVMKTFYLRNAATPADLQQAAGTLKGILDITRIQTTPEQRSLTLRGTPDQMVLAQKLLTDIDKPKAEVVIDVIVMEVSRDKLHTIGTNPPTSASVTFAPTGGSTSSSASGSSGSGLTLNSFTSINAGDFSVSIPGISFSLLASDSNTKVIQRPEIRAMDSEKASLKIGDRVPIATGSFQSGLGGSVNTQFQYLDVGVNVDITPYVHANNEVTLKMSLEISSVTGVQNIGGFNQPTIGQRRIEHEARLADGEVNLIGGILEDTDTNSMSGYPGLIKIPILKYLFGQETKERQQNEIVFAITPHIIRGGEVTDQNLKEVDIGSSTNVTYRKDEIKTDAAKPVPAPAQATPAPAEKPAPGPPAAKTPPQPAPKLSMLPADDSGPPAAKTAPQPAPKLSMLPADDDDELRVAPALPLQPAAEIPAGTVKTAFDNSVPHIPERVSWPRPPRKRPTAAPAAPSTEVAALAHNN